MRYRIAISLAVLAAFIVAPATASASENIARNATSLHLAVNRNHIALLTYRSEGRLHHTLAWGAVNARTPTARHEADLVQARLLGRLGIPAQGRLARLQERVPPLRRPRAQVRRRGLHSARRLVLGRPEVASAASALRPRAHVRTARGRDASLALLGRPSRVRGQARLGVRERTTTCTAGSSTGARASTGSRRRSTAPRSTPGGATSSSTRTTRATAAAGSGRTASSRTADRAPSVTASTRTATGRSGGEPSTARP